MLRNSLLCVTVFALILAWGCTVTTTAEDNAQGSPTVAPAQQEPEPEPAPTPAQAPASGGALAASKISVPLAELTSETLTQALENGGWTVNGCTATRSSMLAISAQASKGDVRARIRYYNPGGDFWERSLTRDNAAVHKQGEILLGVVIEDNAQGAQSLLSSLVGSS